ncbi:hypothetical protein [Aeromonas phage 13AhydR10PP]|nr:hypothetical protein [Aeromonas phage 13AhydR10PP]
MELEHIGSDHASYVYTEGHVSLAEFHRAVIEYGHDTKNHPRHTWLVQRDVPEDLINEFSSWFELCDEGEPGAFPVTCLTL